MVCPCTLDGVCVVCPYTSELVGQHDLAAYTTEEEQVKFEQTTFDMQFKAAFADYQKRKAVYARNITQAYISSCCSIAATL